MKAACLLAVFAACASAQNPAAANGNGELAVLRLHVDLAGLKTFPAGDGAMRRRCRMRRDHSSGRPAECESIDRVADDLSLVVGGSSRYPIQMLAVQMANVLAGHELAPDALSLLAGSLVDLVAIADRSAEARTPVSASPAFRDSLIRAYAALVALGIGEMRAETFLWVFAQNAENMSRRPAFEPIPPVLR